MNIAYDCGDILDNRHQQQSGIKTISPTQPCQHKFLFYVKVDNIVSSYKYLGFSSPNMSHELTLLKFTKFNIYLIFQNEPSSYFILFVLSILKSLVQFFHPTYCQIKKTIYTYLYFRKINLTDFTRCCS